jgi:hypothetical protein
VDGVVRLREQLGGGDRPDPGLAEQGLIERSNELGELSW